MSINISFTGPSSLGEEKLQHETKSVKIEYPCYSNGDCSPYLVVFRPGVYKIELFGGSGGNSSDSGRTRFGGTGGMVSSFISLSQTRSFFLFIGGHGSNRGSNPKHGGYNGGGLSNHNRGCGGGASDLRTNESNLQSRILVAGGGGGAIVSSSSYQNGGSGGGLEGEPGGLFSSNFPCYGAQIGCKGGVSSENGLFGYGSSSNYGGGGGGYWGGGAAEGCGSSGGSSFYDDLADSFSYSGANTGDGYAHIYIISKEKCDFSNSILIAFYIPFIIYGYHFVIL